MTSRELRRQAKLQQTSQTPSFQLRFHDNNCSSLPMLPIADKFNFSHLELQLYSVYNYGLALEFLVL